MKINFKKIFICSICVFISLVLAMGSAIILNSVFAEKLFDSTKKSQAIPIDEVKAVNGKTYYVDANAQIGNNGLSMEHPLKTLEEVNSLVLKPGDQVLFKRNCIWNGELLISASGTADEPILYGSYGQGNNSPVLNGNGLVNATIYGIDVSHIIIENLEVTNKSDQSKYLRGIFINAINSNVEDVIIRNNYVHDVDSLTLPPEGLNSKYGDVHWCGGIAVRAGGGANPESAVILDDVLIDSNRVEECSVTGITAGGILPSENKSKGVSVTNNYIKKCYGDGIVLFNCDGALIEKNVSDHNGACNRADLYYAGIWVIWSDNSLIQYNEVFGQGVSGDGQGFDVDCTCKNTIVQYNYSHDNYGGFLLLMELNNGKTIIRYNVSQNDGGKFLKISFQGSTESFLQADIYNNTYFTNKQIEYLVEFDNVSKMPSGRRLLVNFTNNIFCCKSGITPDVIKSRDYYDSLLFTSNCWSGFSDLSLPSGEENQIVGDPKFSYAGSGKIGTSTLSGYKLLGNSPCLNSGYDIYNNGGIDFWGNNIPLKNNIGAYSAEPVKMSLDANIALSQEVDISSFVGLKIMKDATIAKLVDGSFDEIVSTKPTDDKNNEEWYSVSLTEEYKIRKVVLKAGKDNLIFPKNLEIQVKDGENWKTVANRRNCKPTGDDNSLEISFKAVACKEVRVLVTKMRTNDDGKYASAISEIEIYQ